MSALLEVKIHPAHWTGLDFDKIHLEIIQEIHNVNGLGAKEYAVEDPAEVRDLAKSIIDEHLKGHIEHDELHFVILQGDKTLYEMYADHNADRGFANVYLVDVTEGLIYFKLTNQNAYSARDKKGDSIFTIPLELLKDLKVTTDESLNAFVQQTNRDGDYVALSEFIDSRTNRHERRVLETTEEWIKRTIQKDGCYEIIKTVIKNLERSVAPEGVWAKEIKIPETFKTDADVLGLFDSENIYIGNTYVPLANVIKYLKEIKPDILDILAKFAVASNSLAIERSRLNTSINDLKEVSIDNIFKGTELEYKIRFESNKSKFEKTNDGKSIYLHLRSYKLNNGMDVQVGFQTHVGSASPFGNADLLFQVTEPTSMNKGDVYPCNATDDKGVLQMAALQKQLQVHGLDKILEHVLSSVAELLIEKGYATAF